MTAPPDVDANLDNFEVQIYVAQMSQLLRLSLPESIQPQVVENFIRVRAIAQPVLEFELPDTVEPAPTFQP